MLPIQEYDGRELHGPIVVSYKIDGIQCCKTTDGWRSKAGKKSLYGLKHLGGYAPGTVCEYYKESWSTSCLLRRKNYKADIAYLYELFPTLDKRLYHSTHAYLNSEAIRSLLYEALDKKYEGVMLQQKNIIWKVKPFRTYDVEVLSIYEGLSGKNIGRMGGVVTEYGKVGMGWKDQERIDYFKEPEKIMGKIIEVKCIELTGHNKFRSGRKIKIRWDKEK